MLNLFEDDNSVFLKSSLLFAALTLFSCWLALLFTFWLPFYVDIFYKCLVTLG